MYLFMLKLFLPFIHPFFVSVTEINHNIPEQALEISVRIFTDDFENTLRMHADGHKVDLMNPPPGGSMDSLIKQYILEKMAIEVNGQKKQMHYIGFERVEESIWSYFEVTGVPEIKSLKIKNPILYEYKKEQINMVHVISGKNRLSRKLDNPVADWEFKF
jgi:hypothetical protein